MPDLTLTIPTDVEWMEVQSNLVNRYGYSLEREAIVIDFKTTGAIWQYAGLEAPELFQKMLIAPSVGKFFYSHIRNNGQLDAVELQKEPSS